MLYECCTLTCSIHLIPYPSLDTEFQRVDQTQSLQRQHHRHYHHPHRPRPHQRGGPQWPRDTHAPLYGDQHGEAPRGVQETPVQPREVFPPEVLPPLAVLRPHVLHQAEGHHEVEAGHEAQVHQGQAEEAEVHAVPQPLATEDEAVEEVGGHPHTKHHQAEATVDDLLESQEGLHGDDVLRVVPGEECWFTRSKESGGCIQCD